MTISAYVLAGADLASPDPGISCDTSPGLARRLSSRPLAALSVKDRLAIGRCTTVNYPDDVRYAFCRTREALQAEGWHVDMVVDYGSWARGEARPDSDYDVEVYIHSDGSLYLFSEYAKRVRDPEDAVSKWHRRVKEHFPGLQDKAADLELLARTIVSQATSKPLFITSVFDTRLVLLSLAYETWPLFSLAHGSPVWGNEMHQSLMMFLRTARPFHRRFIEIHLTQCKVARRQAETYLEDADSRDGRLSWLSSIMGYLRNSLSLSALLLDGWFACGKTEVLGIVERRFPLRRPLMEHMYSLKCEPCLYQDLLEHGRTGEKNLPTIASLHRACAQLGEEILSLIRELIASNPVLDVPESEWLSEKALSSNRRLFKRLQYYRDLVGA